MTNTIEIKITGTNDSVAATKSAKEGIDSVGRSADEASVKLKKEGAEATTLQVKLAALRAEATKLGEEFKNTGNQDIFKKFNDVNSKANSLQKFETDFKKLEGDAKKTGETIAVALTGWGQDTGSSTSKRNSRGFFGNLLADAKSLGQEVGQTLSTEATGAFSGQGIIGKLGTLFKNPVTAPILIGSLVTIAPGLLSAVGAAIQTAAAGGFLAAGIAIAAKDPAVSAGLGALKRDIGDSLKTAADPFKQSMLDAEKQVADGFNRITPSLKSAFAVVAPMLQPLISGVMGFANEVIRGMASAARGAAPIFAELKADLPMLGKSIGDFFRMIGQGGQSSAAAFHLIFAAIEGTIELLGVAIRSAALLFDMQLHPSHILKDLAAFTQLQGAADSLGHSLGQAGNSADSMTGSMDAAGTSTSAFGADATTAADAIQAMNDAFSKSISNALALNDQLAANTLNMQSLQDAFKANGKTIDENTVKGAKNVQAIDQLIAGYQQQRDAEIAAGDGSVEASNKANSAYDQQIAKLQSVLTKLLGSAAAAKNFMDQFYSKDISITVHVRTITTGQVTGAGVIGTGVPRGTTGGVTAFAHGGVSGAASGGARSGMIWVGEAGPELLDLSGTAGGTVHTTGDSRRIAAGGGGYGQHGGTSVTLVVKAGDSSARTRQLIADIRDFVSVQGGAGSVLGIRN
jgi:hypothetical protein